MRRGPSPHKQRAVRAQGQHARKYSSSELCFPTPISLQKTRRPSRTRHSWFESSMSVSRLEDSRELRRVNSLCSPSGGLLTPPISHRSQLAAKHTHGLEKLNMQIAALEANRNELNNADQQLRALTPTVEIALGNVSWQTQIGQSSDKKSRECRCVRILSEYCTRCI